MVCFLPRTLCRENVDKKPLDKVFFFPWIFTAGQIWPCAATPHIPPAPPLPQNKPKTTQQLFPQMPPKYVLWAGITHCNATSTLFPLLFLSSDGKRGNFAVLYGMEGGSVGIREMETWNSSQSPKTNPIMSKQRCGHHMGTAAHLAIEIPRFSPGLREPGFLLVLFPCGTRGRRRMWCPCLAAGSE